MTRNLLLVFAALLLLTGIAIFVAPQKFYDLTPGVKMMGPFNLHFIRDVGLAYFASGLMAGWGAMKRNRTLAMAGSLWLVLHAIFHIQIWYARGAPVDTIGLFNWAAVILPAFIVFLTARSLATE